MHKMATETSVWNDVIVTPCLFVLKWKAAEPHNWQEHPMTRWCNWQTIISVNESKDTKVIVTKLGLHGNRLRHVCV